MRRRATATKCARDTCRCHTKFFVLIVVGELQHDSEYVTANIRRAHKARCFYESFAARLPDFFSVIIHKAGETRQKAIEKKGVSFLAVCANEELPEGAYDERRSYAKVSQPRGDAGLRCSHKHRCRSLRPHLRYAENLISQVLPDDKLLVHGNGSKEREQCRSRALQPRGGGRTCQKLDVHQTLQRNR